ncbi:MAG: hypothetical protein HY271_15675 [Deltaproteobacteria bacterium]|nr:hypothetical protein [Deltaproteobacteria bacterium]
MIRRAAVVCCAVLASLLLLALCADAKSKCGSTKDKCVAKSAVSLLTCHAAAEKKGKALDPECIQKAEDKLGDCFTKAEDKGGCCTTGDAAALGAKVGAFVDDVVQQVDPGFPAVVRNKCSAGKKKCVAKKAKGLLTCHAEAAKEGLPTDPICLQKA